MIIGSVKSKKFWENPGHNILEVYNVLVEIWLTTSKMKRDI